MFLPQINSSGHMAFAIASARTRSPDLIEPIVSESNWSGPHTKRNGPDEAASR